MRLRYSFETMELDDRLVAVPVGDHANEFHGVVKLNEVAAFIFELLKDDTTEEAIVDALEKEFDASRSTLAADAKKCIESFSEKGLLIR